MDVEESVARQGAVAVAVVHHATNAAAQVRACSRSVKQAGQIGVHLAVLNGDSL